MCTMVDLTNDLDDDDLLEAVEVMECSMIEEQPSGSRNSDKTSMIFLQFLWNNQSVFCLDQFATHQQCRHNAEGKTFREIGELNTSGYYRHYVEIEQCNIQ